MADNVTALKALYDALGGTDIPADATNADMINAIASIVATAIAKELPAVTADDNSDVLTVVNGAWDKAAPSGGGGVFEVLFDVTYDEGTASYTVSCNHTAAEIQAAASAEKYIVAKALFYETWPYCNAAAFGANSSNIVCQFVTADSEGSALYVSTISWDAGNLRWNYTENGYTLTPLA